MKPAQIALFAGALISGMVAMGCWILTQADAAITKGEAPSVFLLMVVTSVGFVFLLAGAAFLRYRALGIYSVAARTLFLVGNCGILVLLFFAATSRGRIFRFGPLPLALLITFASLSLLFRHRSRDTHPQTMQK